MPNHHPPYHQPCRCSSELRKTKKFLIENSCLEERKSEAQIIQQLRKLKKHGEVLVVRVACDCCE